MILLQLPVKQLDYTVAWDNNSESVANMRTNGRFWENGSRCQQQGKRQALASAGVVVPTDPGFKAKLSTELSHHGIKLHPDWYIIGGDSFAFIVSEVKEKKKK